jgi:hypothetical protein
MGRWQMLRLAPFTNPWVNAKGHESPPFCDLSIPHAQRQRKETAFITKPNHYFSALNTKGR